MRWNSTWNTFVTEIVQYNHQNKPALQTSHDAVTLAQAVFLEACSSRSDLWNVGYGTHFVFQTYCWHSKQTIVVFVVLYLKKK